MSKRHERIKHVVEKLLADKQTHTLKEIKNECIKENIDVDSDKNAISNAVFSLKKNGIIKNAGEKGSYVICTQEEKVAPAGNTVKHNEKIDWNHFFVLKPSDRDICDMKMTITEKGEIRMNTKLQKAIPSNKIQIILSKDYQSVLLNPNGENARSFTKAGMTKNRELVEMIKKIKIRLPANYIVKWDEEYGLWSGKISLTNEK